MGLKIRRDLKCEANTRTPSLVGAGLPFSRLPIRLLTQVEGYFTSCFGLRCYMGT